MSTDETVRRGFMRRLFSLASLAGISDGANAQAQRSGSTSTGSVPAYARAQPHQCLKQSSYDRIGGNADRWTIPAGGMQEIFNSNGPGIVTHIWFTVAARSSNHLKELVLRMFWDENAKPSVEAPVGDFFGLTLGQYFLYDSAFLNCSAIKALNCYFAMPFRRSARMTVTNEGHDPIGAFYSNIDYQLVPGLPEDAMYFHAQYRQRTPNQAIHSKEEVNLDGKDNYVFVETRGRGHLIGVTLGVVQNSENWLGEGDDMVFVDDETKPVINGTGLEDYFNGAWDFGGRDGAVAFSHLYNGAPLIANPEHTGGRYCFYRWHADNPITFTRYLKHTIEHGHANDRADNYYSVAYWYQSQPYTDFPALPNVAARIPAVTIT